MVTVEQLRAVRPDRVAALGRELAAKAASVNDVVAAAVESVGRELAGWHGPAAAAATAQRHALADDAGRMRDAHADAARTIAALADRLDEARQLLDLADSFAALVGCRVSGKAEVSALPPTRLGPLATVYDSVRRAAGSLAAQALVVAEAADQHTAQALGGVRPAVAALPPDTERPADHHAPDDAARLDRIAAEHPSPAELAPLVARFYRTLPARRRQAARAARPALVAGLPGAPLPERYSANRALIDDARGQLRGTRTELAATRAPERTVAAARTLDAVNQRIGTLNSFLAGRTVMTIDPATGTRAAVCAERHFLAFDPSGPGRAAEVIGADLAAARHVALLVPGAHNSLDTVNALAADARLLADTAGPDTAVVTWLGYDSAGAAVFGAEAARRRARSAGIALRRFLAGLVPSLAPGAHVTAIGHGFGTVLVAAALRAGCRPDDVVLVGSPGLGPRIRAAADLYPASPEPAADPDRPIRLWTMRAPGDTIAYSHAHGADPAEFTGITRLETQGGTEVTGHTRYYAVGSESLDNLARVVAGRYSEVTVTTIGIEEELMLAGGAS
jgi:alpha/beta hydrolase family protein